MSNLSKITPSRLSCQARKIRDLKEKIERVAVRIEYGGPREARVLAAALDAQQISPPNHTRWLSTTYGSWDVKNRLPKFMKKHMFTLYETGYRALRTETSESDLPRVIPIRVYPRMVARTALGGGVVTHEAVTHEAVTHEAVTHEAVTHEAVTHGESVPSTDLGGWTLCHDARGIYKGVRRINGRLRSIYIGKDPSQAAEKIRQWTERQKRLSR